ncbi:hypothetical protein BCR44DRAFT_1437912 [Catenaria anguillulae PL171]|uniref:Rho-GAP domain-containing protein n=1 Tax=Catenaria anguillulae PL171 TaxID=765915 RepID=A0A1Y2HGJ7_9FUNG|nr:hypothetical protein BCR44DRAFT_1437912 [Catenaria anguillulae PL171]
MFKRWLASGESEDDRLFPVAHSRAVEAITIKYTNGQNDAASTALALRAVIQCLDAEHQYIVAAVVLIARSVIAHHAHTRMDAENLARMFAPNVFAFRGPMTLEAVKWAIAALNILFSEPNIAFWFTPISYEPFFCQPYMAPHNV